MKVLLLAALVISSSVFAQSSSDVALVRRALNEETALKKFICKTTVGAESLVGKDVAKSWINSDAVAMEDTSDDIVRFSYKTGAERASTTFQLSSDLNSVTGMVYVREVSSQESIRIGTIKRPKFDVLTKWTVTNEMKCVIEK